MKRVIVVCGWLVVGVSIFVMVGWFFNIDFLKRIVPGFVTMKFSTAFSFFLSGMVLLAAFYRERKPSNAWSDLFLSSSILVILILMGTSLFSVVLGFESGIEALFVQERVDAILTTIPGQPSVGTMLAFVLISLLGLVTLSQSAHRTHLYWLGGIAVTLIGTVALAGYILSLPLLFYVVEGISSAMAIHTAVLFVVVGAGFFMLGRAFRHARGGFVRRKT